jgi:hypothetical protein
MKIIGSEHLLVSSFPKHKPSVVIKKQRNNMDFLFKDLEFYYINLDRDQEKSKRLEIKLDLLDVPLSQVHRIKAHENAESYLGILSSQIEAIEKGLAGKKPFVVLEDDVEINNYIETIPLHELSQCTYLGLSSWGLDFNTESLAKLDYIQVFPIESETKLSRIKNMFSAHSILYHDNEYTHELLKNLYLVKEGKPFKIKNIDYDLRYFGKSTIPCDIVMALMQHHYFVTALKIPFFFQIGEHEYCTRINIR